MFENLTNKFDDIFNKLRRRGKLSREDIDSTLREVRMALLQADVHYSVVKDFITHIQAKLTGIELSRAINPAQQVIKCVKDELTSLLGEPLPLNLTGIKPRTIVLVGLQGSGKTTAAGKLGLLLKNQGERVMLVAGDPYRPAAIQQLQIIGEKVHAPVFFEDGMRPSELAQRAQENARLGGYTILIIDTAGRSQVDDALMQEIKAVVQKTAPIETLLVIDSMIGQEALHIADGFKNAIPLTGIMMTKMDGDARGGAAISIRSVTGIPIKYIGTGEKLEAIEVFNPDRMASRILGMGDMLGLIEKAESAFGDRLYIQKTEQALKEDFTFDVMAEMMRSSKKLGSVSQIMDMLPQNGRRGLVDVDTNAVDRQLKRTEAIINSMTPTERKNPHVFNASRRRRIAAGSGTTVQDVNRLIKQYREIRNLLKSMKNTNRKDLSRLFG